MTFLTRLLTVITIALSTNFLVNTAFAGSPENSDVQPDNSAVNQRDRDENAKTADHQASTPLKSDVELTRMIRRDLTKDSSLSTYAKNIKIITQDGVVTLRGPVHNEAEKEKIWSVAEKIVGTRKVHNELEIKQ